MLADPSKFKQPQDVTIRELAEGLQRTLYKQFLDGVPIEEMAIRWCMPGIRPIGEIVQFKHGVTGTIIEQHPFQNGISIAAINCRHFRDIYNTLTDEQQFDACD